MDLKQGSIDDKNSTFFFKILHDHENLNSTVSYNSHLRIFFLKPCTITDPDILRKIHIHNTEMHNQNYLTDVKLIFWLTEESGNHGYLSAWLDS